MLFNFIVAWWQLAGIYMLVYKHVIFSTLTTSSKFWCSGRELIWYQSNPGSILIRRIFKNWTKKMPLSKSSGSCHEKGVCAAGAC